MTANSAEKAEIFLRNFKQGLEKVWDQFGKEPVLEKLTYAKDHYGVMQREELRDTLNALAALKTRVDNLLAECLAMPSDQRISDSDSRRMPTDGENNERY